MPGRMMQSLGKNIGGKIGRQFEFSRQRKAYETIGQSIIDGAVPRTMNPMDAFRIYADRFSTAASTKLAQMKMKDAGMGKWATSRDDGGIPDNWVKFASHSNEFRNLISLPASSRPSGARTVEQFLWVPPEVNDAMRPITDPDWTNRLSGFAPLRAWQGVVKAGTLSLSVFHPKALTLMATANMDPLNMAKAFKFKMDSPEMERGERIFIAHDGITDILGQTYEAYHHLKPTSIPTRTDILRTAPGLKQLNQVAAKITEGTFGVLQRHWKVWDFMRKDAAWQGSHPNHSPAELTAARISIAHQINNVYGGLNWETLGWSKAGLQIARSLMLAPDWVISNFYNLKQAFVDRAPTFGQGLGAGMKGAAKQFPGIGRALPANWEGEAGGNAARLFWMKAMIGGMVANQLHSYAVSGQWSPSMTRVFLGKDKKGNNILQDFYFTGAPNDLTNVIDKSSRDGLPVGLAEWAIGKAAPGVRGAGQLAFNETWMHQPITPKDMDWRAKTIRQGAYMAKDLTPIPFSAQNLYEETYGPNADEYTNVERFSTIINGSPPSHVPPTGFHQTKKGLKSNTTHKSPDLSWMDQAWQGKTR